MKVRAEAKYERISPQKVKKLVCIIKGKPVEKGLECLRYASKAADVVGKVVRSAVANADQNPDIDVDSLVIETLLADRGPDVERFRARARGRGTRILKRTAHITVILAEGSV